MAHPPGTHLDAVGAHRVAIFVVHRHLRARRRRRGVEQAQFVAAGEIGLAARGGGGHVTRREGPSLGTPRGVLVAGLLIRHRWLPPREGCPSNRCETRHEGRAVGVWWRSPPSRGTAARDLAPCESATFPSEAGLRGRGRGVPYRRSSARRAMTRCGAARSSSWGGGETARASRHPPPPCARAPARPRAPDAAL